MLPDFPDLKARANRRVLKYVQAQVPQIAPLLQDISSYTQHEGGRSELTRADESKDTIEYPKAEFPFELTRDEMRSLDAEALRRRIRDLAEAIAEHQTKLMLSRVSEAAESVGNTVNAAGDFRPEHVLDAMRKIQLDFDPVTEDRKPGFRWVMHPDTAEKVIAKVNEWEKDPFFRAELDRIELEQKEAWRAREARRVLAD